MSPNGHSRKLPNNREKTMNEKASESHANIKARRVNTISQILQQQNETDTSFPQT
jgi:hypothetical protein